MKITSTHSWTAAMAALLSIVSLKCLKVFSFIKWSPIGWTAKFQLFSTTPTLMKWMMLWLLCFVLFFLLYSVALFTTKIPPTVSSLLATALLLFAIEWMIHIKADLTMTQFMKKVSIPFACLLAIIVRFVVSTSVYTKKTF